VWLADSACLAGITFDDGGPACHDHAGTYQVGCSVRPATPTWSESRSTGPPSSVWPASPERTTPRVSGPRGVVMLRSAGVELPEPADDLPREPEKPGIGCFHRTGHLGAPHLV
jgi:hypothetical protein